MSTMVERVARAIYDKNVNRSNNPNILSWAQIPPSHRQFWCDCARAAIEAMIPFVEEIPLTSLVDTSDRDRARIWSSAADSQRGCIVDNLRAEIEESDNERS